MWISEVVWKYESLLKNSDLSDDLWCFVLLNDHVLHRKVYKSIHQINFIITFNK